MNSKTKYLTTYLSYNARTIRGVRTTCERGKSCVTSLLLAWSAYVHVEPRISLPRTDSNRTEQTRRFLRRPLDGSLEKDARRGRSPVGPESRQQPQQLVRNSDSGRKKKKKKRRTNSREKRQPAGSTASTVSPFVVTKVDDENG